MADPPKVRQWAEGEGIAQAYGEGAQATVSIYHGIPAERVAILISEATLGKQAELNELASRLQTTETATSSFLRTLSEGQVPSDQLASKLAEIASRHLALVQWLRNFDTEDPIAASLVAEASEIIAGGLSAQDYQRADQLFELAIESQHRFIERRIEYEHDLSGSLTHQRRCEAAMHSKRAELSLTQLAYIAAAQHYDQAANAVTTTDLTPYTEYRYCQMDALRRSEKEQGNQSALWEARWVCQRLVRRLEVDGDYLLQARAGVALSTLLFEIGSNEAETATLDESIATSREVLSELEYLERTVQTSLPASITPVIHMVVSILDDTQAFRSEETLPLVKQLINETSCRLSQAMYVVGARRNDMDMLGEAESIVEPLLQTVALDSAPNLGGISESILQIYGSLLTGAVTMTSFFRVWSASVSKRSISLQRNSTLWIGLNFRTL